MSGGPITAREYRHVWICVKHYCWTRIATQYGDTVRPCPECAKTGEQTREGLA